MKKGELTIKTLLLIGLFSFGGLIFMTWEAKVVGQAVQGKMACCTAGMYQNAPNGWAQSDAHTWNEVCFEFETASQCCYRSALRRFSYDFKLLGSMFGTCGGSPQLSYPVYVPQTAYYHRR